MVIGGADCFCELGPGGTLLVLGVDGYSERPNRFHREETHTEEAFCAFSGCWDLGWGWGSEAKRESGRTLVALRSREPLPVEVREPPNF